MPEQPWQMPTGAPAWGYPEQLDEEEPPGRRTPWGLGAAILATALVAGSAGGFVGYRSAEHDNQPPTSASLRDKDATLGNPIGGTPVSRPPTSVAGIAARVLRSVVSIEVDSAASSGTGSGVVLRSDGYILTNNHVVADGGTITVSFIGGAADARADVVGLDPETDLAVIKVRGSHRLTPAALGSSAGLVVGDPVVAIGSPLGLAGTVTSGIISALNRTVRVPGETGRPATPLFNAIQTDAAINPGNSGGALVDGAGRVIGINSAIASLGATGDSQSGSIGVGFAIPIDEARSIAEQLIRRGKATHPALGVSAVTVGADGNGPRGAQVRQLLPGGSAAKAGLKVGDVITKVGSKKVDSVEGLIVLLRTYAVGDNVTITYIRGGATKTARLVLQNKGSG